MSTMRFRNNIITDARPWPADVKKNGDADLENVKGIDYTHLMNADASRVPGFFHVDSWWFWKGGSDIPVEVPHTHDFSEVIALVGSNEDDPHDLGGEITIWLDDDKHVITKTSLIFLPPGTRHCPIVFNRIERPVFLVTIAPTDVYSRKAVGDAAVSTAPKDGDKPRYSIVTETKEKAPDAEDAKPAVPPPPRTSRGAAVLHLEDDMVPGSFYVDFVWVYEGTGQAPPPAHDHEWPELLAIAGCDPEHPHDLSGKMTMELEGEVYEETRSNMVCIPGHVKHCPWKYLDFKKPGLIFTASPSSLYYSSAEDHW